MDEISVYRPGIILAYTTFFVAIASPGPLPRESPDL